VYYALVGQRMVDDWSLSSADRRGTRVFVTTQHSVFRLFSGIGLTSSYSLETVRIRDLQRYHDHMQRYRKNKIANSTGTRILHLLPSLNLLGRFVLFLLLHVCHCSYFDLFSDILFLCLVVSLFVLVVSSVSPVYSVCLWYGLIPEIEAVIDWLIDQSIDRLISGILAFEWRSRLLLLEVSWQLVPRTRCGNAKSSLTDLSLRSWNAEVECDGMSETGVSSCDRYCGELCYSKHKLYSIGLDCAVFYVPANTVYCRLYGKIILYPRSDWKPVVEFTQCRGYGRLKV